MRKISLIITLLVLFSFVGNPSIQPAVSLSPLIEVHFIDVGQGDSILIKAPEKTLLIDAGDNYKGDEVASYLTDQGITFLDYLVSSHYHADHIGGSDYVLYNVPVELVLDRGGSYNSQTFLDYVEAAGSKRTTISAGETIDMGSNITAAVLQANFGTTENNKSIVIKISYGEVDFLFGGDCEASCEASFNPGDIEVYKVHHHGSKNASSQSFLEITLPEIAVISVGENNPYGHPHSETLERLENIGAQIYRTDKQGNIVVKTDGVNFWVELARPTMHVGDILMSGNCRYRKGNIWCKATAIIPILDSSGLGVAEATVSGSWSGAYTESVSGTTRTDGKVTFSTKYVKGGGTFTFTVTDVSKEGWIYNSTANVETSDSITLP